MAGTKLKLLAILCLVVLLASSVEATHKKHKSKPKHGYGAGNVQGNYTGNGLKFNYYQKSCPQAESIITAAVKKAYNNDTSIIAGLIRLFFHDCFVRGCDASVLLDSTLTTNTEKEGAPNKNSLRGFEVIDEAKANVEKVCPWVVSCADVVGYAARDSIVLGGGKIPFGLWLGGRKDGDVSIDAETILNLPAPFATYPQLVQSFKNKGLNEYEMVILSGAHTVGRAHCAIILARLYNFNGVQGAADPAIDPSYLPTLQAACPSNQPSQLVNMDMRTPAVVDTNYVQDVLRGRGLFQSDNALRTDPNGLRTLKLINNQNVFSPAFSLAMLKMGTIEVKTGNAGKIRQNCRTTANQR